MIARMAITASPPKMKRRNFMACPSKWRIYSIIVPGRPARIESGRDGRIPAMQPAPGQLSREEWTKLLLGVTLLFGLAVRIFPPMLVGFPINDGGMFLVMIRELRANGFLLPALTNYNLSSIPF